MRHGVRIDCARKKRKWQLLIQFYSDMRDRSCNRLIFFVLKQAICGIIVAILVEIMRQGDEI